MESIAFTKVQSVANDFVLFEAANVRQFIADGYAAVTPDLFEPDADPLTAVYTDLARRVCPRHFGIGSDGLLIIDGSAGQVKLRMFNPDGSEDFCGNGLRCAALYAFEKGWVANSFKINHHGETVPVILIDSGLIEMTLRSASFLPKDVPHTHPEELFQHPLRVCGEDLAISSLSTGSAHTVIIADFLPDDERLRMIGSALEVHPLFPERTSVIWVRRLDARLAKIRIWERGAGETLGCGTGSSAAAVVMARLNGRGGEYEIQNPGGEILVELEDWQSSLKVRGYSEIVYEGEWQSGTGTALSPKAPQCADV